MAESFMTNRFAKTVLPRRISDGELFIIGRFKDLLTVCGSNHHPDEISAGSDAGQTQKLRSMKREIASAVSNVHWVADLVFLAPGCEFGRLDVTS